MECIYTDDVLQRDETLFHLQKMFYVFFSFFLLVVYYSLNLWLLLILPSSYLK